ncbi:MAG: methyl-accepting chemotaxis protein [Pseudomonadota bacterium]|nr:methyl-accepting chemotaxis protein [Pseudomonadota bacterium]
MNTQARLVAPQDSADELNSLNRLAGTLSYELVDISGFLDQVQLDSTQQLQSVNELRHQAKAIVSANGAVLKVSDTLHGRTCEMLDAVEHSVSFVQDSSERSRAVATWVQDLWQRMNEVGTALEAVEKSNAEIADIARHVNILAVNAKIEAARAGEMGRGFGVVAEAINELSQKTALAAQDIAGKIGALSGWVGTLRSESSEITRDADLVIEKSAEADRILGKIADGARESDNAARAIRESAQKVGSATDVFAPTFDSICTSFETTSGGLKSTHTRITGLIDKSEGMVQAAVSLGGTGKDAPFIDRVREDAARISEMFTRAVESGRISMADLFDTNYTPIPGTKPEQFSTRFTRLTDDLLPEVLESALSFDPKVVFCAAVDKNGYLPTHNRKFSQKPGNDVAWNTANCRNRRIFDDRVGLKAGRSTRPFLLQVYRRDMGGGTFAMMKDLSAPITVNGRHWGGLRMAYSF